MTWSMSRRTFAALLPRALAMAFIPVGCATMDAQADKAQDHTFRIVSAGELVRDISYEYGDIRRTIRHARNGGGRTFIQPMPVPEVLIVKWTTSDGETHEAKAPIRSRVPADMRGNAVSAEIDKAQLRVFLETGPTAQRTRAQIYP